MCFLQADMVSVNHPCDVSDSMRHGHGPFLDAVRPRSPVQRCSPETSAHFDRLLAGKRLILNDCFLFKAQACCAQCI